MSKPHMVVWKKTNTDHSHRNTRGMKSVNVHVLAGSSETEVVASFNCNDCKKQFIQMIPNSVRFL